MSQLIVVGGASQEVVSKQQSQRNWGTLGADRSSGPASGQKHGRGNAVAVMGLLAAAFAIAACSPQQPGPGDMPASSTVADMPPIAPAGVHEAIANVQQHAKERGVTLNKVWYEGDKTAVIAFVPKAPNGDLAGFSADVTAVSATAHGFTVRIKIVQRTVDATKAIQSRLEADIRYWAELGITITGHGINTDGDTVIADVLDAKDLDAIRKQMTARYGPGMDVQSVSGRASVSSFPTKHSESRTQQTRRT